MADGREFTRAAPTRGTIDPFTMPRRLEAASALQRRGVKARLLEPSGDPATQIERVAEQGEYDTVVVGSRSLGAVGRLLAGSLS